MVVDSVINEQTISHIEPIQTDTLEYYLADQRGRWLGNGFGDKKEMPCLVEENAPFDRPGVYRYCLKQGMREDVLKGVSEVGLIVEKK